jgi:LuxR family maltose regulon positive regulatory protein
VELLPDELFRTRPVLSVAYAQALLNTGKLEAAHERLLDVEQWFEPATGIGDRPEAPMSMVIVDEDQYRSLPISFATARTYHAQAVGDMAGTVKYAQQVLELLPEGDLLRRGQITGLLGLAQWARGELEAAHQTFFDGMTAMQRAGNNLGMIQGVFVLADIKMTLGHLREALSSCEYALQLAMAHGKLEPVGTEEVYISLSALHREQGDLKAAAQDLRTGRKLGEQVKVPDWQCAAIWLVR